MKYYIVAGESSGDLHASNLIKAIKQNDSNALFFGCGGEKMRAEGCKLSVHLNDMDFMGFVEVIKHLPIIRQNFKKVESDIEKIEPDILILIDYPGFNLRLLKKLEHKRFKKLYYIAPQLWAWKKNRISILKKLCDAVCVILPFEKEFYRKEKLQVSYVGHPLLDVYKQSILKNKELNRNKIALIPGSRKQEIGKMLPVYLEVANELNNEHFEISGMKKYGIEYYKKFNLPNNCSVNFEGVKDVLKNSKFALVTSGTATLETAIFNVPQIVCYKLNIFSYQIAKLFAKVKYISLVNLILDKNIVTELIQNECNKTKIIKLLDSILTNENKLNEIYEGYNQLFEILGEGGASKKVADIVDKIVVKN